MVVIGRGTYGEVSRAVHKDTGDLVAIKKMTIALPGEMHHQDGMAITTLRELRALQELSHVNIVKLREVVTEAKDRVPDHLYLVMDYAEMDLAGIVKQCRLTRRHIRFYMYQILEGLAYIQKHHLLHRDLKSANVLVTKNNVVKLADWGLCKFQREGSQARLTNPVVTLWYRAPELLLGTQHYDGGVDIWSCGMIMAEMLIGKPFLDGRDEMDQLHKIFDVCGAPESLVGYRGPKLPNKPSRIAEELRKRGVQDDEDAIKMVAQLCAPDPAKRPSANDACDIDFLWTRDPGHEEEVFPNGDPATCLPRLVPYKSTTNMESLHEYELKQYR